MFLMYVSNLHITTISDWLPGSSNQGLTFGASGINIKKQWKIEQKHSTKQILITEKVENIYLVFVSVGDADSCIMSHNL